MPNDYFQFKQFRIEQGQCAMKVSTDACLLGAVAGLAYATRLLDIGTGTSLLALMAAQRNPLMEIEAVEVDERTAAQALANVRASPWANRIRVWPESLAAFKARQPAAFSHILCNPPFFRQSLPSAGAARRTARHASPESLTFGELTDFAARFLTADGQLTVLLPPPELRVFQHRAAAQGLALRIDWQVRHRPGARLTRHIATFGHAADSTPLETRQLLIQGPDGAYSAEFRALLGAFYLHL